MTPQLAETMRRATEDLYPESSERILDRALIAGSRRRRRRHHLAVGLSSAAVLGVVATSVILVSTGGRAPGREAPFAAASSPAATYAPGSATEVPGGPVIPTDRRIVDDESLQQVIRDLAGNGNLTGLAVEHVTGSGVGRHPADRTTDGRAMSFQVDGGAAWIAIGRWDGYHAVGFEDSGVNAPLQQKVATTAREACGGSYRTFPAITCAPSPEGWYSVTHPNAGGVSGSKELWVDLYTEDGYVVRVHSLNTANEKQGSPVSTRTSISEADSLAIARSPRWFTTR